MKNVHFFLMIGKGRRGDNRSEWTWER